MAHSDQITKQFTTKLERATDIILGVVAEQNKEIQKTIEVLNFMQDAQKKNNIKLGGDYFEAKKALIKIQMKKKD